MKLSRLLPALVLAVAAVTLGLALLELGSDPEARAEPHGGAAGEAAPGDGEEGDEGEEPAEEPTEDAEDEPSQEFVERFREAQRLMGRGKDEKAESLLRELLEERPRQAEVHHALAVVLRFCGRDDEALEAFVQAAGQAPDDAIIRRDAGTALLAAGRLDEALEHLTASRRLVPEDVETWIALGRVLRRLGRGDEAEKAYRAAHRTDPDSVDARVGLAAAVLRDRPEEALELLAPVPKTFLDVALVHARALIAVGRAPEAVEHLVHVFRSAPEDGGGLAFLAEATWYLLETGAAEPAAEAAAKWWRVAAAMKPPSVLGARQASALALSGLDRLADAHEALGAAEVWSDAPAGVRCRSRLIRAALLLRQGEALAARAELRAVAEDATEEAAGLLDRRTARRALGLNEDAALSDDLADPRTVNDVQLARWMAARFAGDAGAVGRHLEALRAATSPPGEFPALLAPPVPAADQGDGKASPGQGPR